MLNKKMLHLGRERSAIRELFEYGNERKKQIGEENVFDFSIGNPNAPAPDCVHEELLNLIKTVPSAKMHGYTSAPGDFQVRAAVADYENKYRNAELTPEFIYITCGASASLSITFGALTEEGDEYLLIAPYFPEYKVFIENAGGILKAVPSDSAFHLDIAKIEQAIGVHTKGVVINSPNNPTGAVYSQAELTALADLLTKKSAQYGKPIFLISDEPYRELVYGTDVPSVFPLYKNTIVCYSFSKSMSLAGERIGYIAVSPKAERAQDVFSAICGAGRSLGFVCAPALFQRVCARCLGKVSDISFYRENRDLLYRALTAYGFECANPEGAFYLFVKALEKDANAFSERAKKYNLLLVPSDTFGAEGYVRVSYCVERQTIERSLPAFQALAESYR